MVRLAAAPHVIVRATRRSNRLRIVVSVSAADWMGPFTRTRSLRQITQQALSPAALIFSDQSAIRRLRLRKQSGHVPRNSLSYAGRYGSCLSCANLNVGMRLTPPIVVSYETI